MTGQATEKLVEISGPALAGPPSPSADSVIRSIRDLGCELLDMLTSKNGFYAFESALHVYPISSDEEAKGIDLESWNRPELWKGEYGPLEEGVFFAEDIFGGQFFATAERVFSFDPETANFNEMGSNLEEWASKILDDYGYYTGHPLAHSWQVKNGPIPSGMRLLPKIPFVMGGDYTIENFYICDSVKGMRYRASIARQIADVPDGAKVRLTITDD